MATNLSSFPKQLVVESLDIRPAQLLDFPVPKRRDDMVANVLGVVAISRGLDPDQVFLLPNF